MISDPVSGLGAIADRYALFVVDQWGVLHDGHQAHPGAVEALTRLKQTDAAVALLSNSGKRVAESHKRLATMGFSRETYDLVITSGEQVYQGLKERADPFYAALGPRFLMFTWDADRGIVEDTGFEEVADIEDADFILCAGTDGRALPDYDPILARALDRDLPLTCANPDRVSVQPDGSLKICPGAIAERYEAMGGRVRWHGKPNADVYDAIREATGVTGTALGIGDSLAHDIAGAKGAGMDSLFITGGIHRTDLPEPPTAEGVTELGRQYGAVPTWYSTAFRW